MDNDYYTYAYLREDRTPYYIGKGRGNRIFYTFKRIKPPKDKSRIIFLKKNLTEAEAFKHEVYMIFVFGRKDLGTGILRNLTNGGEGVSGRTITEETRRKLSAAHTGVPKTKECRRKMSEAKLGENSPNYGKFGALHHNSKAIIAIEPDGTERHYGSVCEAARELVVSQSCLSVKYLKTGHVLTKGKFKGWQFLYENR